MENAPVHQYGEKETFSVILNELCLIVVSSLSFRMSFVIELRYEAEDEHGHHLFCRRHVTRVEQSDRPKGRTLMVCNIPPWCPAAHIKPLFSKFGSIEKVDVQLKPGKNEDLDEDEVEGKFKVIFSLFEVITVF